MERDPETATALYRGVCLVPARRRKTDALKWAARSLPYGRLSLARFFFFFPFPCVREGKERNS